MESANVGFAVLAYSDIDGAAETLRSIAHQEPSFPSGTTLILAHDCESFTLDAVEKLTEGKVSEIQLVRIPFKDFDLPIKRTMAIAGLSNEIPDTLDWVWILEDGVSLHSNQSLNKVREKIQKSVDDKVKLIHACEANRAQDTDMIEIGRLEDFCEIHGYFEMLEDLSTIIIRRNEFKLAFGKYFQEIVDGLKTATSDTANFIHSQCIFICMRENDVAIFDNRLIKRRKDFLLDDDHLTLERVLLMIDQVCELSDAINPGVCWPTDFFRVRDGNLWLKLLELQREVILDQTLFASPSEKMANLAVGWERILRLVDHIEDKSLQAVLRGVVTNAIRLSIDVIDGTPGSEERMQMVFSQDPDAERPYPTTLFNTPYQLTA